jgi:hypothetical protein
MQIGTKTINDSVKVNLEFAEITGPYYSQEHPKEFF